MCIRLDFILRLSILLLKHQLTVTDERNPNMGMAPPKLLLRPTPHRKIARRVLDIRKATLEKPDQVSSRLLLFHDKSSLWAAV